jgi:hemolysin III
MTDDRIHLYSPSEERLNFLTHFGGAILALVGLVIIIFKVNNRTPSEIAALLIYGIATLSVYSFSSVYHGVKNIERKIFWQKIDHCMVSMIIWGTAAPMLLMASEGTVALGSFITVSGFTVANIVLNLISVKRFRYYSQAMYFLAITAIALGVIFDIKKADALFIVLSIGGVGVLLAGWIFYFQKNREYTHVIWHIADVSASAFYFFAFLHLLNI